MRKFFAHAISSIMINKSARHKIRGILEFGLVKSILTYFKIKNNKSQPKHYLSICAIAKNEGPYFKEWIEFHKMLGVEKFYIYDNESNDGTRDILAPYVESGLVEYTFFPGQKMQLAAYEDCLARHRFESRWIAFVDLDEFIVPMNKENIPDYLKKLEKFSVIEINWVCYGSGGIKKRGQGFVTERFRDHSKLDDPINRHIKSIVNPKRVISFIGAHEAVRLSGKTSDANGQVVNKNFFDRNPTGQDIIRINHYAVKSFEEFLDKRARGRARSLSLRGMDYFTKFDLNDIKDDNTMEKYVKVLKDK